MSKSERERRFHEAIAKAKWWSDLVGIFAGWALTIGITFVSARIIVRLPTPDNPVLRALLIVGNVAAFLMIGAFLVIYTARIAWLIYCWISMPHPENGGRIARWADYAGTAVLVVILAIGTLSIAMTIANIQMPFAK